MKTTLLLGLFTGSVLAATVGQGPKPATKDTSLASSLPKKSLTLSTEGAQDDWCGGISDTECANLCNSIDYRCYFCSTYFCHCSLTGC